MERFRVQCTRFGVENQGGISNNLHFWVKYSIMAKVLISLVSQQRIPNVLAIMDPYFGDVDEYLFLTTAKMEQLGVVGHMLEATRIAPNHCRKILVKENDLQSIIEQLQQAKLNSEDQFLINLTGGTKIMSLSTFSFFNQGNWKASHYYLPISRNVIQQIFLDEESQEIPISFEIGVIEYLKSYGLTIEDSDFSVPTKPQALNFQILNFFLEQKRSKKVKQPFWRIAGILRGLGKLEVAIPITRVQGLESFLDQFPLPLQEEGVLQPEESRYLTGGWFEEFIYTAVKGQLQLADKAIGRNVVLNWLGVDHQESKIELDVIFMYRNTIHVIECKTALRKKEMTIHEHFKRVFNQLAALRKEMGLRVKMIFITLDTHLREDNGQYKAHYEARAKLLDIALIDRLNILAELRDYLEKL